MPRALAIAAHPDDIEFLMAGTLLLLREAAWEIHYFNIADGCCGSTTQSRESIAQTRLAEAKAAAEFAGASFHPPVCHDLEIFYERITLARVASIIRRVGPQIVLTHSPMDYMEDHTSACRLAVTATFARGMPNFRVDPPQPTSLEPVAIYHAQPYFHRDQLGQLVRPHLFVNVSEMQERKIAMLSRHVSQKEWLDQSQGHNSYLATLRQLDAECGRMSQRWKYAEGWRRHLSVGFCDPNFDPLVDALHTHIATAN